MIDHDRIAEVYEGTIGSREFQRVSRRRIHWMCAQVTGRDVLDVGCSQGIASILLGREGHRVVGIDREHEAIRAARERLDQEEPEVRQRVEFRIGEGRALGFSDRSFDAVLLGEVLEHQLDSGKLLAEARRLLRPGGRIVITTPYGIHPYPDHMEPLYLSALLERLSSKLSIAEIALVDRYVGLVAERSKDRAPRVWRRALRVAEGRLADQDETVETLRALVAELRDGIRALERSLQEEDLTKKATEIQRDAAQQRQHEIELEHRAVLADLERTQAQWEEADAARQTLSAELEAARARLRELESEAAARQRQLEQERSRVSGLESELQERGAELAGATAELQRAQAQVGPARRLLAEARTRMAELVAEREAANDAALSANLRTHEVEAGLARLREQAALDARNSAQRADALQSEAESLRTTVDALTAEGAALRETLTDASLRSEQLEQDLAAIHARLGYRIGRRLRRLSRPFRRGSHGPGGGEPASGP